jgi:hypothetical protein
VVCWGFLLLENAINSIIVGLQIGGVILLVGLALSLAYYIWEYWDA